VASSVAESSLPSATLAEGRADVARARRAAMFFLQLLRAGWSCRTQVRSRSARGRSGTARGTARAAAAVRVRASRGGAPALPARARGRAFTACAADDQWGALIESLQLVFGRVWRLSSEPSERGTRHAGAK